MKIKRSLLSLCTLLTTLMMWAGPVSQEQACEVARQWLSTQNGAMRRSAAMLPLEVKTVMGATDERQQPLLYAVNIGQQQGYVVVSGPIATRVRIATRRCQQICACGWRAMCARCSGSASVSWSMSARWRPSPSTARRRSCCIDQAVKRKRVKRWAFGPNRLKLRIEKLKTKTRKTPSNGLIALSEPLRQAVCLWL